jgi:hypothetical protein
MKRLSRLILVFSVLFAALLISPAFLGQQLGLYPLMKIGDVTDLLTPLALIPLYWLLFRVDEDNAIGVGEGMAFMVLAALWVEGQGIHLSANSIRHLLENVSDVDVNDLAHFYDEVLSHYLWHIGVMGLSAVLIVRQLKRPFVGERSSLAFEGIAGVIYGLTFFIIIIEGQTAPLGVPFAALMALGGLIWGRRHMRQQPLLGFFIVAYLVATLLFVAWAIRWGGLPEFSEVGIID